MSGATDKRFKSFLWSQTRKADFSQTRLSVPEAEPKAAAPAPAPAAEANPPGRAKGRLTPLEQAAMRMSEFCAPATTGEVPGRAPAEMPAPAWHRLHVHRPDEASEAGTSTPLGRLNVRKLT
jgi:hypothetical protein